MVNQLDLKLSFNQILQGFCFVPFSNSGPIYIRHFNHLDYAVIEQKYHEFSEEAKSKGVTTTEEKEKYLIQEGLWSEQKNRDIISFTNYLSTLKESKSKVFDKDLIKDYDNQIKDAESKILNLQIEKSKLTDVTVESYANRRTNEFYIFYSLYQDKNFEKPLYNEEDFDELDEEELNILVNIYNTATEIFNNKTIRKIALSNFFLSLYSLCGDNPYYFYGKPLINLTFYQCELVKYGKYYKGLLSNSDSSPAQEIMDDPDKFEEWFGQTTEIKKHLEKNNTKENSTTVLFGLSDQNREQISAENTGETLSQLADKKGGTLGMEDILKAYYGKKIS